MADENRASRGKAGTDGARVCVGRRAENGKLGMVGEWARFVAVRPTEGKAVADGAVVRAGDVGVDVDPPLVLATALVGSKTGESELVLRDPGELAFFNRAACCHVVGAEGELPMGGRAIDPGALLRLPRFATGAGGEPKVASSLESSSMGRPGSLAVGRGERARRRLAGTGRE